MFANLCTIVAHNTAQNRPDNHSSHDVYLREEGTRSAEIMTCQTYTTYNDVNIGERERDIEREKELDLRSGSSSSLLKRSCMGTELRPFSKLDKCSTRNEVSPIIIRPYRSTAYVDATYCYRRSSVACRSVCQSVMAVSPAKTAEPIEMPFGIWTPCPTEMETSPKKPS